MNDALANLRDIQLPPPVSIWPLATGWWLLIGLALLAAVGGYLFWRWRRRTLPRRWAVAALHQVEQQWQQQGDTRVAIAATAGLLKRFGCHHFSREAVAGLTGQAWIEFLYRKSPAAPLDQLQAWFVAAPYRAAPREDLQPLFQFATRWMREAK